MITIPNNNTDIKKLPSIIGIYIYKKKKEILYIGKSINIKARLLSHIENADFDNKEKAIVESSDHIDIIPMESEFKTLLYESRLINENQPKYNKSWRDDKSYLYVKITISDNLPKVSLVRKENDGKSWYFGPFSNRKTVEKILREIRRVIPYCSQPKITAKACFYSKIGLCDPCPNIIENASDINLKNQLTKKYKRNIAQIIRIFEGKSELVLRELRSKLDSFSENQRYEEAIDLRNRILTLEKIISERLNLNEENPIPNSEASTKSLMDILSRFYQGVNRISRIECYDISNTSFQMSTGSMVVFINGVISKGNYRRFKIKNLKARSDFEMIEEVLRRRFKNNWGEPDIILIDGGKPQVRAGLKVLARLKKGIPVLGIAKNPDRLIIGIHDLPTLRFSLNNVGFNLIRSIRDESHRFAKKYHLLLRKRAVL